MLGVFVGVYAVAMAVLTLAAEGRTPLYPVGLALLVVLAGGLFAGTLLDSRKGAQRFYLALTIVPCLTLARFAFEDASLPILDPLFAYLLLAATLLVIRQSAAIGAELRRLDRRDVLRALPLGAALAAAFTIVGLLLPGTGEPVSQGAAWIPAVVLVPVALLDELWFRGVLQGSVARVTSPGWGWLATVAVFVAYGAPFETPVGIGFRLAYSLVLGAVVIRRENLPVSLVARTALAAALALLSAGFVGGSLIV